MKYYMENTFLRFRKRNKIFICIMYYVLCLLCIMYILICIIFLNTSLNMDGLHIIYILHYKGIFGICNYVKETVKTDHIFSIVISFH